MLEVELVEEEEVEVDEVEVEDVEVEEVQQQDWEDAQSVCNFVHWPPSLMQTGEEMVHPMVPGRSLHR